ncbi:MAG TPA: hypothetical protein VGM54_14630 [Chthoniobacter sp.]|jgi:hypothetical protein
MPLLPRWCHFGSLLLAATALAQTGPAPAASKPATFCEILHRLPPDLIEYSPTIPYAGESVSPKAAEGAGFQPSAAMNLALAAARGDAPEASESWPGVDPVFAHQTKGGDFGSAPTAAAFTLCELTRALLVVQESPLASQFKDRVDALKPGVAKAAHWLTAQRGRLMWEDRASSNRLFAEAEAFLQCGRLLDDPNLVKIGRQFEDKGMKLFRPADGVFPETGTADPNSEAASLVHLQEIVACYPDPRVEDSIAKGMQWELAHIGPDGTVRTDAKKPVFFGSKMLIGPEKAPSVGEILLALLYYSERTGDAASLTAAQHLHQHYSQPH